MSGNKGAKFTIYWLEHSRAQRIVWLLEELDIEYEIKIFKRDKNNRAGSELKKIHPLGRSPTLGITPPGSEKEIILAESETIMDYVCDHFGSQLVPKRYPEGQEGVLGAETEEWMRHKFLMDYTEGSLLTPLIVSLVTQGIRAAPVPFFLKPVTGSIASKVDNTYTEPELKNHLEFLEGYLKESPSKGEFFCSSSITSADIMLHFALEACIKKKAVTETIYPTLYKYTRKLQATASYKRGSEKVEKATGEKFIPFSET